MEAGADNITSTDDLRNALIKVGDYAKIQTRAARKRNVTVIKKSDESTDRETRK